MNKLKDYYYFAEQDYLFAKCGLENNYLDNVTALAAQSVEKFLKHLLIVKLNRVAGDPLLSTHNLRLIIDELILTYPSLKNLRSDIVVLKDYYYTQRYPNDNYINVTKELADEAIMTVETVKKEVDKILTTSTTSLFN